MLFLGIWLTAPVLADLLASWKFFYAPSTPIDMEARGQFGDSFGVATSIFSFLSFSGVLFVYHMQKRHTDIRDKPFLMATIPINTLPVKIEAIQGDTKNYQLVIEIGVNNYSNHLAHSTDFTFTLNSNNNSAPLYGTHRSRPIMKRDADESISEKWILAVDSTRWFLDDLSSGISVGLAVEMTYYNSNSIKYKNINNFEIFIDKGDYPAINELRSGDRSDAVWGGGKHVSVEIKEAQPFVTAE